MGRTLGHKEVMKKTYKVYDVTGQWRESLGLLSKPFTLLVYGKPKNGKTSFVMMLCKYLAMNFGKVYYNSAEEGDSKTIQDSLILAKMDEVPDGKFTLGDRDNFEEMVIKLRKNRALFVVIDSIDYIALTKQQFKQLIEDFPNKSFIIISWEKGGEPKNQHAKDIKHMVGAVIVVKNYIAHVMGRYGNDPDAPYVIWDRKKAKEIKEAAEQKLLAAPEPSPQLPIFSS